VDEKGATNNAKQARKDDPGATACAGAALAAPFVLGAGPNFDVVTSGISIPAFNPSCNGFYIVETGTASGTHVGGAGSFAAAECVGVTAIGHATIGSTNGDLLTLDYQSVSSTVDSAGNFRDTGTFQFTTDGTGRFASASGSGTYTASGNFFTGATTTEFVGSLDLNPHQG
jgi:hypothetical protein